ncbi:unnamed protein product [Acanthoscelides obtectus]|uniref:Uncharacterized protein n=1 Tax=Acanthoscelides obtectus TaxID=200917 RepID=A0A9P0M4Z4_ACAOB|nr:unnamed protein product [Acanthoscelides obtectus]CAK1626025.1 General odorant-binding protein 83a [Acanthoscelides obtectus]
MLNFVIHTVKMYLTLLILLVTLTNVYCVSDEIKELMNNLHKTCVGNTGVDEALIVNANKGQFEEDEKFKCYTRCIFDEVGLFDDDNKFDVEGAIAMLPDEMKDTILGSVIKECGASCTLFYIITTEI